jgi:precorrin-2 dehydrogenase
MTLDETAATSAAYPLILTNLARMRCVVVGGGDVAERKVLGLLAGGARPAVISPTLTAMLADWRGAGRIEHVERAYRECDLAGAFLAVAATSDRATNAAIAVDATRRGILVNIADDPSAGNFHTAAVVRRGDLLLAVSTAGGSPTLTARIRRELEARYGDEYARLLSLLRSLRAGPARALPPDQRTTLWRRLVTDTLLGWLRDGEDQRVEQYAQEQIRSLSSEL